MRDTSREKTEARKRRLQVSSTSITLRIFLPLAICVVLFGGSMGFSFYLGSQAVEANDLMLDTAMEISGFRSIDGIKYKLHEAAGNGPEIDRGFDTGLKEILEKADKVETRLLQIMRAQYRRFRIMQGVLILACIGLALLVAVLFGRFMRRRNLVLTELKDSEERYQRLAERTQDIIRRTDPEGNVIAFEGISRDISERRQAEEVQTRLNRAMQERIKELQCMYGTAKSINERNNIQDIFRDVVELIPRGCQYPDITCCRIHYAGDEFTSTNFRETEWRLAADIPVRHEKPGKVEIILLEECPDADEGQFSTEERSLINGLSRALGMAIELKIAEERQQMLSLTLAEERQRQNLSTLLHDGTCQSLIALKSKMELIQRKITEKEVALELDKIIDEVIKVIKETRTLMYDLNPPPLYEQGLIEALAWLFSRFERKQGIPATFKSEVKAVDLAEDRMVLVFRTVSELLVNVEKHAQAKTLSGSVNVEDGLLTIRVTDDGIGFETSSLATSIMKNEGFGLYSIRERLRINGGQITVDSSPGRGTGILLEIPVTDVH